MRLGFGFAVDLGGWRARKIASRGHTQSFARLEDGQDCGHLRPRILAADMDQFLRPRATPRIEFFAKLLDNSSSR